MIFGLGIVFGSGLVLKGTFVDILEFKGLEMVGGTELRFGVILLPVLDIL